MAKKIEGDRLDVALAKLRQSAAAGEAGAATAPEEFAKVITNVTVDERRTQDHSSLEAEVVDFVIPRITEPGIFHAGKSIALLEHFLDDLLPHLDESEELRVLAARVIGDEISRQREVLERLQAGIAA
jgi:hypothetical protein